MKKTTMYAYFCLSLYYKYGWDKHYTQYILSFFI